MVGLREEKWFGYVEGKYVNEFWVREPNFEYANPNSMSRTTKIVSIVATSHFNEMENGVSN